MRFPIKNPLAGLILRMFNLPTGTILIKRLRSFAALTQPVVSASNWIGFNTASP